MLTEAEKDELIALYEEENRDIARSSHLEFMQHTWIKGKQTPMIPGFHTCGICSEIDRAFERYRKGESTYLLISVHHRAGKSDIASRYLGAHFLGEFPDDEVMQVSYQSGLASKFSAFGRNVFRSDKYKELYPNITLSKESNAKDYWEIAHTDSGKPTGGKLYASGLTSGLTGNGWNLGILDDYCAGRKEAESKVMRDNAWDAFTNDFMTRAAPVCICIVLATQWHWDDINGRIKNEMKKNPDFPDFKVVSYPAKAKDYNGAGKYPGKYLFMERYPESWYRNQYATLGKYSAMALLDCNPTMRDGGVLATDGIMWVDDSQMPDERKLQRVRVWDLAHTAKQRTGDDPDYTAGTKLAFERRAGEPVPYLYIWHVARCRKGAKERDEFMKMHAKKDGYFCKQAIENSLDAKDAYEYIRSAMPDISWTKLTVKGDKLVKASPLEPIFETPGHVIVCRGSWNDEWLEELIRFDGLGNDHDDQVDNLSGGYEFLLGSGTMQISAARKEQMRARRGRN